MLEKNEAKLAGKDMYKHYGNYFRNLNLKKNKFTSKTISLMDRFLTPYKHLIGKDLDLLDPTQETMKRVFLNRQYGFKMNESKTKRLLISKILNKMSKLFNDKVSNKANPIKLLILSGHDTNIIDVIVNLFDKEFIKGKIINALKNEDDFNFLLPPLASSFIFELIKVDEDKEFYVRLVYNGVEITKGFNKPVRINQKYNLLNYQDFNHLLQSRIHCDYKLLECYKIHKTKN